MSDNVVEFTAQDDRKQEIIMRDVMGSLEEIATILAYDPWPGDFEIVAIFPADQENADIREEIVLSSRKKPQQPPCAEVISYEERKRLKLSA